MDTLTHGRGPFKIVAIHGIQGTNRVWLPLATTLQDRCTFILPNLPGRGNRKPYTEQDMTLGAFANVIEETIQKYINDGEPYCLAGWSMGVSVALAFMGKKTSPAPQKLILLSGVPDINEVSWFTETTEEKLLNEIRIREQRLQLQAAAEHRAVMWTWQSIAHLSLREQCQAVDIPSLIITGEKDQDSPLSAVSEFRQLLSDHTFLTIENAGHSLLTDNTDAVASAFTRFLNLE